MDLAQIHHKANILIAQTYGSTNIPIRGSIIVSVNNIPYIVYFHKIEDGWCIDKTEYYNSKI